MPKTRGAIDIGWADRENLPAPLKGRRVGKLACPL